MLKRLLIATALLFGLAMPALAQTGCLPVTGIFTAVQEQQYINAALYALRTNNAGGVAPSDDCSGAPVMGQPWLNTAATPSPYSLFDGSQQDVLGFVDRTNNLWLPTMGGGIATLSSASVTDLCTGLPQNEITISGSIAITSFGAACQIGQFKFLKFTGSPLITYNSGSILTPSGQSFFAENGGRAIAIYLGGGVTDVFYYHAPASDVPPAAIAITTSPTPDPGYVLAAGQALSTTACPNAFAKYGYLFGGSGSTFYAPNLGGRYLAGLDNLGGTARNLITWFNADTIGNIGGNQSQTLGQTNLPNVNFPLSLSYSASSSSSVSGGTLGVRQSAGTSSWYTGGAAEGFLFLQDAYQNITVSTTTSLSISGVANSGGSNTAFSILPPTFMVGFQMRC